MISTFFPVENEIAIDVVGSHSQSKFNEFFGNYTFQYQYSEKYLLITVNVYQVGNQELKYTGITVQPLSDSLRNSNKFSFEGKTTKFYIFPIISIFVTCLIIYSFISACRSDFKKRKFLWLLFILCGFCVVRLNWSTGAILFQPLFIQFLGSGFIKSEFSPLVLSTSFPFGALIFLFLKFRSKKEI